MNERAQLGRKMSAEQFAAFDTALYLDTHADDASALQLFNKYLASHAELKEQYERLYGPLTTDAAADGDCWAWVRDPWPWEREAN